MHYINICSQQVLLSSSAIARKVAVKIHVLSLFHVKIISLLCQELFQRSFQLTNTSVVFDKPAFHISPNIEARKKKQCKYYFGEK